MDKGYTILSYKVYKAPGRPQDNGEYISRTPIKEQAEGAVQRAKERGELYFIKVDCSDGVERYYF